MSAVQKSVNLEPVSIETFAESTERALWRLGIVATSSILNYQPEHINDLGFEHLITDSDGVLNPYGKSPDNDMLDFLEEMADNLEHGVSIVTNNRYLQIDRLPNKVRLAKALTPNDFKPSSRMVRDMVISSGAKPEKTIGFGDGLTDMMAYHRAKLGRICLVKSCGPHPLQDFVHRNIYAPAGRLLSYLV